jgi:hypothetical protein
MDKPETKANEEWSLCLWLVHSSFAFVSGLSILHLPLSLACPFFICLCLWLVYSSFAFMKNGQARDKGK